MYICYILMGVDNHEKSEFKTLQEGLKTGLFGKILGAARQTGKNIYSNVNFAAERGEYRKAPAGYKLAGTYKSGTEARETAHRYQISGYRVKLESAKDGYDHPITALYVMSGKGKGSEPVQKKSTSIVKVEKTASAPQGKVRKFAKNLFADTAAAAKTAGNKLTGDNALRRWAENTVADNDDYGGRKRSASKKKPAARGVKRKKAAVKITKQKTYSGKRYELAGTFKSVPAAQTAVARLKDHKCAVRVVKFTLSSGKEGFAVYARKPAVGVTKRKPKRSGWYYG